MTFNRSFNQRTPGTQKQGQQTGWLRFVFVFLLLAYWVFAWYMERINLSNVPLPSFIGAVLPFPLPPSITFLREMIHWRVWRHFLPVVVGSWLAYEAAASLVMALYDLPNKPGAKRLLSRLSREQAPAGTALPIQHATLEDVRGQHVMLRVGGPGIVKINRGDVAVTELNGRFPPRPPRRHVQSTPIRICSRHSQPPTPRAIHDKHPVSDTRWHPI